MKRIHVMLRVENLEDSIDFYSHLFDHEPTVRKDDYAKWLLDDPRVNFSIAPARAGGASDGAAPGLEHLGIQAETPDELAELRGRIGRAAAVFAAHAGTAGAAGSGVIDEGETTCCYAASDKTWVVDGQGVAWEAFYTHGTSDSYYAPAAAACCGSTCCADAAATETTAATVAAG